MSLVDDIERIHNDMVEDGTVDNIIKEQLTKSITEIVHHAFRTYSKVGKELESRIESRMLETITGYDWESYIPKLDAVLTDIINCTTIEDTKNILENFNVLMVKPDKETMLVSDLFKEYKDIVAHRASHTGHEVTAESGEPEYEPVAVEYFFEKLEKPRWSSCERGVITFRTDDTDENDEDSSINIEIPVSRWDFERKEGYEVESNAIVNVANLRNLRDLELMVMKLARAKTRIIIDTENDDDEVYFYEKPEIDWV